MEPIALSIEEVYHGSYEGYEAVLDQSLNPRSPDILYKKFNTLGPTFASIVLDIGCRDAAQACELHHRFGCRVEGIDVLDSNIQAAQKHITNKNLTHAVHVVQGDIHEMSYPADSFDFIWCRDVLGHMRDLRQAFKSCARVLKPNGKILIFQVFATDLLTEDEAKHLWLPLATNPENMSRDHFKRAFTEAGFSVLEADTISSEWREYGEETESKRTSIQLLRIARLRRHRERFLAEFGAKDYAAELANAHYGVYQMLGKLSPVIYSLINSGDRKERTKQS